MILKMYKLLMLVCILISFDVGFIFAGMNEKQMKSAAKLMRNACQPKHKATDAAITDMHNGVWNDDPAAKCYMYCVMVMLKVVKKSGEYDWDSGYAQVDNLPEPRIAVTKAAMDSCRDKVQFNGDKCDSAWQGAKCIYFANPENYFLP